MQTKKKFWIDEKKSEVFIFNFESPRLNSFTPTGLEFLLVLSGYVASNLKTKH